MPISFIEKHLSVLVAANPAPPKFEEGEGEGDSPIAWFNAVESTNHGVAALKLKERVDRATLLSMAADGGTDIEELTVSILAWGGMRPANRNRLFGRSVRPWMEIAGAIRSGSVGRRAAYDGLARLRARKDRPMSGMGPAYFTKLIYFLSAGQREPGYILDQWAGTSINLIAGANLVKMDEAVIWKGKRGQPERIVSSRVSDVNTADDYERYCCAIEELSVRLGSNWTPGEAERALMSRSGAKWRQHVVAERFGSVPGLRTSMDA